MTQSNSTEKKSKKCNQRTKICKITRRKDGDKAGNLRSKNTGTLNVSKNIPARKPKDTSDKFH